MRLTPEQSAAQKALQDAVERHVELFRPADRGDGQEIVTDWALVSCSTAYDKDGDRTSAYDLTYSNGELDEHRAYGLFMYAAHLITNGRLSEED